MDVVQLDSAKANLFAIDSDTGPQWSLGTNHRLVDVHVQPIYDGRGPTNSAELVNGAWHTSLSSMARIYLLADNAAWLSLEGTCTRPVSVTYAQPSKFAVYASSGMTEGYGLSFSGASAQLANHAQFQVEQGNLVALVADSGGAVGSISLSGPHLMQSWALEPDRTTPFLQAVAAGPGVYDWTIDSVSPEAKYWIAAMELEVPLT